MGALNGSAYRLPSKTGLSVDPMVKASMALSLEIVSTELRIAVHLLIYARIVSSDICLQACNSSNVLGRSHKGSKYLMKSSLKCSQES